MRRVLLVIGGVVCLTATSILGQIDCPGYIDLIGDPGSKFGLAIDGIGDIDGDGYDDFIVGAPLYGNSHGKVVVYSGIDGTEIRSHYTPRYDRIGYAVAGGGDFNGDGIPDYAAGAPGSSIDNHCAVYVFSGDDGTSLLTHHSDGINGEQRGYSVDFLDDIDGDGYDELIVGCPYYDGTNDREGRVLILDGPDGSEMNAINGGPEDGYLGKHVARLGLVNDDAVCDFIVSRDAGVATVRSGQDFSNLLTAPFVLTLDAVGDVNSDGHADFVCGYPDSNYARVYSGYAAAYNGQTASTIMDLTVDSLILCGICVAGVGCITDDTAPDIGVVSFGGDGVGTYRAYVFSGATGDLAYALGAGTALVGVGGVGDVDNDGFDNVAVGWPTSSSMRVYSCTDIDGDGLMDMEDNCPDIYNPNQDDADVDSVGDSCDNCLMVYNPDQANTDEDEFGDACDNCPDDYNPGQYDGDSDEVGYICDNCPTLPNPEQEDVDNDGFGDVCDNCQIVNNPAQVDTDADGIGDACDNCPNDYNPDQADIDGDLLGDDCDDCPSDFHQCCWGSRVPGDLTCDGSCAVDDLVQLVDWMFRAGPPPCPIWTAGDVTCDNSVDVADLTYLTSYMFSGGPPPCNQCP